MKTAYIWMVTGFLGCVALLSIKERESLVRDTALTKEVLRTNKDFLEFQSKAIDKINELKIEIAALQDRADRQENIIKEQEIIGALRGTTIRMILIILEKMVKGQDNQIDNEISQKSHRMLQLLNRPKFEATEFLWKTHDEERINPCRSKCQK